MHLITSCCFAAASVVGFVVIDFDKNKIEAREACILMLLLRS